MKNKKYLYILLIIVPIIIFFIGKSFSLEYPQEIRNVEIESNDYDDPGSFHIDKSAKWISLTEAEVTFDLNTTYKEKENSNYKDVILVMDISGSMGGEKLDKAKSDAMELVDVLLSNSNNHVALITFDTSSEIISEFTNNKNEMLEMIENLSTKGCTNYNAGLLNVLEVMEDYQKDDNHDLVTLFLTDGYPNEDTPNQVATYNIIKDKNPYMTINGIQYEMGRDIIQQIIDISDNQFVANQETLNGVLFDAVITPLSYETFIVSDYVNKDYFYLDNISDVTVTNGTVALQEENGLQKIVWTLDNNPTGFKANMKIKLQLKSEYHNTRGFYPTNDHETIDYKIIDDEEENVSSTLTPVLKRTYNVIYDANAPEGCTLPDIPSEEHYVYEAVTKRTETPVCEGYVFKGYQFDSNDATDITIINDDTFVMPGHDVIVRGTWAQQGIIKSMDGTVYERLEGTLMNHNRYYSQTFGKSISRDSFESITTVDNIEVPSNAIDSWDVSQENNGSVIAWYTDTDSNGLYELYIGQDDGVIANPDSSYAFSYFKNVKTIDLSNISDSNVTNMSYMFYQTGYNVTTFNLVLGDWNTSSVTNMKSMFDQMGYKATTFSLDLSGWDTSNVTNMSYMFQATAYKATTFSLNLSGWNTSSVTDMGSLFAQAGCEAQTWSIGDLSDWTTSSVTNMSNMFYRAGYNATTWNVGDIGGWDTSKVTNMSSMFQAAAYNATTFNLNLSGWTTSSVTNMYYMFGYAGYNATTWSIGDLSDWDTSAVNTMSSMFYYGGYKATTWNIGDLSGWTTSSVTNMHSMFCRAGYSATTFNLNISGWDTSNVTKMGYMFSSAGYSATTWNIGDLSGWNTSNATDMSYMFSSAGENATTWNIGDLSGWNTSSVTNMRNMFSSAGYSATTWNMGDLSGWNTSSATDMSFMFSSAGRSATTFNLNLSGWNTSNVTSMRYMFNYAGRSATTFNLNLSGWNTSSVTDMNSMFKDAGIYATTWNIGGLSGWNTSSVTDMNSMFYEAGMESTTWDLGDLSGWITSNVTDMSYMFYQAGRSSTTFNMNISSWDTTNVNNMTNMFCNAGYSATTWYIGNLSGWKTSNVTNMSFMFSSAGENATTWDIGDISSWGTSNVTKMSYMFKQAGKNATTWNIGDLSGWDTSSATNMSYMFYNSGFSAQTFNLDLSNWNTSSVTGMTYMFARSGYNATTWSIGNLSNWDTSNVTNMSNMFESAGYNAATWNGIGTLKVYATDATRLFNSCQNAKVTLKIYSNPASYSAMFLSAATVSGSGITVNYSSATTNIDSIIATKSSDSNVIKGDQFD